MKQDKQMKKIYTDEARTIQMKQDYQIKQVENR